MYLRDLDVVFSSGVTAFSRSTFGYALERAKLYSVQHPPATEEVTARPMLKPPQEPGNEPDIDMMRAIGATLRKLDEVARRDPTSRVVLELLHGNVGAHWAHHERGRMVALFPLTKHGKELIERARRQASGAEFELSDADRLKREVLLDQVQPDPSSMRRRLIVLAMREAQALQDKALTVWAEVAR